MTAETAINIILTLCNVALLYVIQGFLEEHKDSMRDHIDYLREYERRFCLTQKQGDEEQQK